MMTSMLFLFAVCIDNVVECVSDCGLGCTIKRYCMSIFMYARHTP